VRNKKECLEIEPCAEGLVLHLHGEIDHHSAASLRSLIDEAILAQKPRQLVMDLADISFMDSAGLGLILGRLSRMQECGGELILHRPSKSAERMIYLAGLERVVRITEKEEKTAKQEKKKGKVS